MEKIIELSTQISTPLMLAGIVVAVLWGVFKYIISKSPDWSKKDSPRIIILIIKWVGFLSLVSIVLGFSGFAIKTMEVKLSPQQPEPTKSDFIDNNTPAQPNASNSSMINNCSSLKYIDDEQIRRRIGSLKRKKQYDCAIDTLGFIRNKTGLQEECESLIRYFIMNRKICLSVRVVGKCSKYVNEIEYRKLIELEKLKLPQEERCDETGSSKYF